MTLLKRYKKYQYGSSIDERDAGMGISAAGTAVMAGASSIPGIGQVIGTASSLGTGLVDAIDPVDKYGNQSLTGSLIKGNLQGGTLGLIGAAISYKSKQRAAERLRQQEITNNIRMVQNQSAARVSSDPTAVTGNLASQYFANGGHLNISQQQTTGGKAQPLNDSAAEFSGNTHAEGGIQLPGKGVEVEDGETTNGDYVFSEKLGFAKLHKPIAAAIGKIEKKALSPERVTSIKLLKEKENNLKLSQEYIKQMHGLN